MAARNLATNRGAATARTLATGSSVETSGNAYGLLLAITHDATSAGSGSRNNASNRTAI
jgi:hypothetical protein